MVLKQRVKCTINTGRGADIFTPDHSQSAAAEVVRTDVLATVSVYHFKEAIFCHLELTWADFVGTGEAWNIWIAFRLFIKTGSPLWPVFHTSFNSMDWCQICVCVCVSVCRCLCVCRLRSCTHITIRRKRFHAIIHTYAHTHPTVHAQQKLYILTTLDIPQLNISGQPNYCPHVCGSEGVCSFRVSFLLPVTVGLSGARQKNSMWPGGGD